MADPRWWNTSGWRRRQVIKVAVFLCLLFSISGVCQVEAQEKKGNIKVGVLESLFNGTAKETVEASVQPFRALMERQTGYTGDIISFTDPIEMGEQLSKNQIQLGVFHGIEFARAREKYTDLKALAIAVNQDRHQQAHLVVRTDNSPKGFSDLKGKSLEMDSRSPQHCRLFLDRLCREAGLEPKEFFGKLTTTDNIEDALDDVVDGLVPAALIDGLGLERFRSRKPGRYSRLKDLKQSEVFPPTAVVYQPGVLDDATLESFRKALFDAPNSADGRQMLTLWKLTSFEKVPDDYEQNLKDILKSYPQAPKESK